jgi:hypothetical protein
LSYKCNFRVSSQADCDASGKNADVGRLLTAYQVDVIVERNRPAVWAKAGATGLMKPR